MRSAAALLAGLALAVAGCGGDAADVAARGSDAARLVPPDALAFISADANLDSEQWRRVRELTGNFFGLQESSTQEIEPALGDEVNLALLGIEDGEPEAVALVQPEDEAKLRELAREFDGVDEHYTVEQVGDWHVVADSPEAFAAVRAAEAGRSLADVDGFQQAMDLVEGESVATVYADGARLRDVPGELGAIFRISGSDGWVGARVFAEDNAARVSVHADSDAAVFQPQLLRGVPSGAFLAITFKNAQQLLERIDLEPSLRDALGEYRNLLTDLAPALEGEAVFYVAPGVVIPTIGLELETSDLSAVSALTRVTDLLRDETNNVLDLHVQARGDRVSVTNNPDTPSAPPRLVDDESFKDALAAADAPEEVSWLVYANLRRLLPALQAVSGFLDGDKPSAAERQQIDRFDTFVAYGAAGRLELRVAGR